MTSANPYIGSNTGQATYQARSNAKYVHPNGQSRYAMVKECWGDQHAFMRSYGLKPHNDEDYVEATKILDVMLEDDWEAHRRQSEAQAARAWADNDSTEEEATPNAHPRTRSQEDDSGDSGHEREIYENSGHYVEGYGHGDGHFDFFEEVAGEAVASAPCEYFRECDRDDVGEDGGEGEDEGEDDGGDDGGDDRGDDDGGYDDGYDDDDYYDDDGYDDDY